MAKLSLKVVVAGRTYPLTVDESEEKKVHAAAEDINKAIKLLQENYAVKDMQDLLAMTALQLASKSEALSESKDTDEVVKGIEDQLQALSDVIDDIK